MQLSNDQTHSLRCRCVHASAVLRELVAQHLVEIDVDVLVLPVLGPEPFVRLAELLGAPSLRGKVLLQKRRG